MSIMAFALVAAIACGSDTDVALPASGGGDVNPNVETERDPTNIDPELSGSMGLPAPGAENTDEMIVMLDGALDPADGETRLNDDELYVEGVLVSFVGEVFVGDEGEVEELSYGSKVL